MLELGVTVAVNGAVIAMVALAFHLVIRVTGGVADFATGQYVIIGALAYGVTSRDHTAWPLLVVILAALLVAAATSVATEMLVIRRLSTLNVHPEALEPVIATVALLWIWEQLTRLYFGDAAVRGVPVFEGTAFKVGFRSVTWHELVAVIFSLAVVAIIIVWLSRSSGGQTLRAIGDNRYAAEVIGLPIWRTRLSTFAIAGAIAGLAGTWVSGLAGIAAIGGAVYTVNGFVALFLGGASSPTGVLVGAFLLAAAQGLVARYVGTEVEDYVVLLLALLVFRFRPQGLISPQRIRAS